MCPVKVGFIGFGEVAPCFGAVMRKNGAAIAVYDVLLERDRGEELLAKRAGDGGVVFRPLAVVVEDADYVLSTVTTQAAMDVARQCARHLRPGQVYVDLNSTAPSVKREMDGTIGASGADFVEGAILGAVGATGVKTRILVGGKKGPEAAATLTRLGLNVSHYSPEIGKASVFKMLRSIFSKGLEALIIEALVAGRRAGIEGDLWRDLMELVTRNPFDRVASNWVQTHAVAYERRYHEMEQVTATMREIGVEPLVTAGTESFFRRSCSLGLNEAFPVKPDSHGAVIAYLERRLRGVDGRSG